MGISLNKMPLFSRAEMDKYVARTGKSLGCAGKKSVPTGLKKPASMSRVKLKIPNAHVLRVPWVTAIIL